MAAFSAERRPTGTGDIQKALERGAAMREQKALVPGALQSSALVLKIGDVRCGHATIRIEDAKGEGGAVYRLRVTFKAAMAQDDESAVMDYGGAFLLGPDLALISGKMSTAWETRRKDRQQATKATAELSVQDGVFSWQRFEQGPDGKEPAAKASRKTKLNGVRPIPRNALLALAVFVSGAEKDGWKPDPAKPLCVPALETDYEMDSFQIEPAWISFDLPAYTNPKGTAAQMRARFLVGEITGKGLEVEPPEPAVWLEQHVWALDGRAHALSHPAPDDPRIKIETVDPAALDENAPLDLEKIRAEAKKF